MAFEDILRAITEETDQKIAEATAASAMLKERMKEDASTHLQAKKEEIEKNVAEKKMHMDRKADVHIAMEHRNAVLRKKKELLDTAYAETVKLLSAMEPSKLEPLFARCLARISEEGVIHPATTHADLLKKLAKDSNCTMGEPIEAKGGFRFVSKKKEMDFTLEQLVEQYLRPKTEVELSNALFN